MNYFGPKEAFSSFIQLSEDRNSIVQLKPVFIAVTPCHCTGLHHLPRVHSGFRPIRESFLLCLTRNRGSSLKWHGKVLEFQHHSDQKHPRACGTQNGLLNLQSQALKVFSNTEFTHQIFGAQPSSQSTATSYMTTGKTANDWAIRLSLRIPPTLTY